jgi:hypothetical protein
MQNSNSAATPASLSHFSPAAPSTGINLVINNIIKQHPIQLDFVQCGEIVNYTPAACYVARSRGQFPVRVRQQGGRLICHTADLIDYITNGVSQANQSVKPIRKSCKKTGQTGRPSKRESLDAAAAGLTVKQLRAQKNLASVK